MFELAMVFTEPSLRVTDWQLGCKPAQILQSQAHSLPCKPELEVASAEFMCSRGEYSTVPVILASELSALTSQAAMLK